MSANLIPLVSEADMHSRDRGRERSCYLPEFKTATQKIIPAKGPQNLIQWSFSLTRYVIARQVL